jgi:hypothetical protein
VALDGSSVKESHLRYPSFYQNREEVFHRCSIPQREGKEKGRSDERPPTLSPFQKEIPKISLFGPFFGTIDGDFRLTQPKKAVTIVSRCKNDCSASMVSLPQYD